eukprot:CAMPEP_0180755474 /NCGR_PEP_ID=MMETSP1038_2-20121128/33724_1 /TAXON_ID=632150 /ORGANISM="Azadinium spinosum, Strain 3D9" /LENGTH=111 /DNA_ID=CAMNT_0022789407 /DNA_START=87 /DNA_END=422 /DNA_ORIENTATION=-
MVLHHIVLHAVAHIARIAKVLGHVIWEFRLEEVGLSALTGPLHKIMQCVLHSEPIHRHIVPRDYEARLAGVRTTFHQARHVVICTPQPQVVSDDMPRRNPHHDLSTDLHMS